MDSVNQDWVLAKWREDRLQTAKKDGKYDEYYSIKGGRVFVPIHGNDHWVMVKEGKFYSTLYPEYDITGWLSPKQQKKIKEKLANITTN